MSVAAGILELERSLLALPCWEGGVLLIGLFLNLHLLSYNISAVTLKESETKSHGAFKFVPGSFPSNLPALLLSRKSKLKVLL